MLLKSTKDIFLCLIVLSNLSILLAFKCKFSNHNYEGDSSLYTCEIIPDSKNEPETHMLNKTDADVFGVVIDGITHLTSAEFPFCERFENIQKVKIFKVKSINVNFLQKCVDLTTICVINGNIEELPEDLFSENIKLTLIELSSNNLKELPENIFLNLNNLTALTISSGGLLHLPPNIFKPLQNLHTLMLNYNKFKSLNPAWFEKLQNLHFLILNFNKISDLPKDVFKPLTKLQYLWLWANELTVIHSDSFGIQPNLHNIDLKQNKINEIDNKLIDNVAVVNLDMEIYNVCFDGKITSKSDIKKKLKKCFENYKPRKEPNSLCGTHKIGKETILGSTQIEQGSYPWNAALLISEGKYFCGGTVVSSKTIVTAAHCFIEKLGSLKYKPSDITVLLGAHNLDIPESNRKSASVKSINIHSEWNQHESSYDADIAVLELLDEIQFNDFIQPICLIETDSEKFETSQGKIIAFEKIDNFEAANIATIYESSIINYQSCTTHKDLESLLSPRTFCSEYENVTESCNDNSGSGLIIHKDGNFFLRGIVSASLRNISNNCKIAEHLILTDVLKFTSFIKSGGNDVFDDKLRVLKEENKRLKDQVSNLQETLSKKNRNWLCKFV